MPLSKEEIEGYRLRLENELRVINAWLAEHPECINREEIESYEPDQRGGAKEERRKQCDAKKERKVDIEKAIKRIEAGTFGICIEEKCGRPIELVRLEGDPVRQRCALCQLNREANKKNGQKIIPKSRH